MEIFVNCIHKWKIRLIGLLRTSNHTWHQVDLAVNVAEIKTIINNGLKAKMIDATNTIEELKEKIDKLEDFQWFREFINNLRDRMFTNIIKWALLGGLLAFVASFFFTSGMKFWSLLLK